MQNNNNSIYLYSTKHSCVCFLKPNILICNQTKKLINLLRANATNTEAVVSNTKDINISDILKSVIFLENYDEVINLILDIFNNECFKVDDKEEFIYNSNVNEIINIVGKYIDLYKPYFYKEKLINALYISKYLNGGLTVEYLLSINHEEYDLIATEISKMVNRESSKLKKGKNNGNN